MIVIEIFAAVEEIVADATDSTEQFLRTTGGIHVVGETVPALLDVVRLRRLGQNRRADVGWRTSPWLRHQYFAEWTFGVCVVTKVGTLVFAHDTSGIVFDSSKLAMTRLDQNDLMLAIPRSTGDRKVRVMRMSAASLDMSERAIRAQATRTSSFEDTFTDLLDPGMFPTSAYGRVGLYGRYLGFTQGRVRDGKPNLLPLEDYLKWTEELAVDLAESGSSSNPVFSRYAQLASPPSKTDAQPLNVLIDLGDTFEDFRGNKDGQPLRELMLNVETPDLCSDVNEDGKFEIQISGSSFPCQITYNSANHRYKVSSDELDRFFHAASADSALKPAGIPIINRPPFRFEAGHHSNQ